MNEEIKTEQVSVKDEAENAPIKSELEIANEKIAELNDKILRALADAENTKRRAKIDAENLSRAKMLNLATSMLPIVDAAKSALKHNAEDEGIKMILNATLEALGKSGIKEIKSVGEKLNPNFHQAISTVKSDKDAGTIVEELQTGFEFEGSALRPALVVVSA